MTSIQQAEQKLSNNGQLITARQDAREQGLRVRQLQQMRGWTDERAQECITRKAFGYSRFYGFMREAAEQVYLHYMQEWYNKVLVA